MDEEWKVVSYKKRASRSTRATRTPPQVEAQGGCTMMDMDSVIFRRPDRQKTHSVQPSEKTLHDRKVEKHATEGDLRVELFPREFVIKVQSHRVKLHRDQKWLAQHLNVPVATITQLELGRMPYDPKLKSQLQTFLAS